MNGFSTEEEGRSGHDQICCLLEDGERCRQPAGNASYSKRIEKTVQQRRLKLNIDQNVSVCLSWDYFNFIETVSHFLGVIFGKKKEKQM